MAFEHYDLGEPVEIRFQDSLEAIRFARLDMAIRWLDRDTYRTGDWMIINSAEEIIPRPVVIDIWKLFFARRDHYRHRNDPGFRNGPVPRTGGRGGGSIYRAVRTIQERRNVAGTNADFPSVVGKPLVRGRRSHLPSSYDDIRISGHGRSWKAHRRTQYKPVDHR